MAYTQGKKQAQKSSKPEEIAFPGSSWLQSATYDSANYSLTVNLKDGTQNVHHYVFPSVWGQFKETPSKGSFYVRTILKQYPAIKFKSSLKVSDLEKAIKENRPKRK